MRRNVKRNVFSDRKNVSATPQPSESRLSDAKVNRGQHSKGQADSDLPPVGGRVAIVFMLRNRTACSCATGPEFRWSVTDGICVFVYMHFMPSSSHFSTMWSQRPEFSVSSMFYPVHPPVWSAVPACPFGRSPPISLLVFFLALSCQQLLSLLCLQFLIW